MGSALGRHRPHRPPRPALSGRPAPSGRTQRPRRPAERPPRCAGPRRRTGILLLPPWTRAPGLVWRQPIVVFASAAILGCAASSAALFLTSAAALVVALAAGYAHRAAARTRPAEIIRLEA